jgi:hypothetical protein
MYEAVIVILTAAGIQLTFSWNYHRAYVSLYKEFHNDIEQTTNRRLANFREELKRWISQSSQQVPDSADSASGKKIKELYDLVSKAEEPRTKYEEAREALRTLYKYLLASGLTTLLGLVPQVSGNAQFDILHFVFLFPLMAAAFSWDTYSKTEDDLVRLRDEGV